MQIRNLLSAATICFILPILLTVITGCNGNGVFRNKLLSLDSALVSSPDSVFHVLSDMRDEAEHQSRADRMYYELLRADAQNKAYIDFTTDSVLKSVAEYYDNHGSANEKMRAHYLLGCTYRDLNDAPMELQCFQEATEKADTTQEDCDYYTLVSIYGQMADIYYNQHLPNEELASLTMCEKYAIKDRDSLTAIKTYELRLRSYYNMCIYDSVLSVSENARNRYLAIGRSREAARLLNPAISILLDKGDYEKARVYMDIFKRESGYFEANEITSPSAHIHYRSMGRYALYANQIDSAIYYFRKLAEKKEYEAAYGGLLSVYEKTGQADSILKYSRLYAIANDSSHYGKEALAIAQMTAMYNYGLEKHNAENTMTLLLAEKEKSMTLLVTIFIFVIFIVLLFYVTRKTHKKNIDKIKALNQEIDHKTLLLQEALENNDEEELIELKKSLDDVQKELQKYKRSDALAAFFDSDIYKLFHAIGIKGNSKITSDEWDTMYRLFNSTFSSYTDFIHSGKSMTEDQIKVCMLIRMGFGESEMANVLGVDLKRISRIKLQVNQKLFNVTNARELVNNLKTEF